jgi:predicted dehydrogenase
VAACEEDDDAAKEVTAGDNGVELTHRDFGQMMSDVACDAVAVGDYYGRRGSLILSALEQGKHVISDKPLCTGRGEVDRIEALALARGLKVGCMLTMRDSRPMLGLRQLLRAGTLGEVHAITFGGQHPLRPDSRPHWYFEEGKHGGTINDIGIHALDAIPWMTGLRVKRIEAARCWNAFADHAPHFQDGAQLMLTLDNGCGVLGDVSYFAPDAAGDNLPLYWRVTVWGRKGVAEISNSAREIRLALNTDHELRSAPLPPEKAGGYLESFLRDIAGEAPGDGELDTKAVLASTRLALEVQKAADEGRTLVDLDVGP